MGSQLSMNNPSATRLANLGPRGIARRQRTGIIGLLAAVVVGAGLFVGGANPWWRLVLFPILYLAAVGFLQAHGAT